MKPRMILALSLLLAACGSGNSPDEDEDAGTDGGQDTETGSEADSETESESESESDTGSDTETETESETESESDTGEDTDTETFACLAVEPGAVSTQVDGQFNIIGTGFEEGMTVTIREVIDADTDTGTDTNADTDTNIQEIDLGEALVDGLHSATSGAVAGTVAVGKYEVVLTSIYSETATCPDTIDWLDLAPPSVTSVTPAFAWKGLTSDFVLSDKNVVVEGTGFEETPMVTWVSVDDPGKRYPATVVLYGSDLVVDGVCPSESSSMPVGFYYVELTNPNGLAAYWIEAISDTDTELDTEFGLFEVTGTPPPRIFQVNPFRSPASEEVMITITGTYFLDGAVVQLVMPDTTLTDLSTGFVDSAHLTALIPAATLTQGTRYPVRVTNPDGQYDIYYIYEATPSSQGHSNPFEIVSDTDAYLTTPRWRHGSEKGFDAFGGSYLYTAGGLGQLDTDASDYEVLSDVEIIPVSIVGEPGTSWVAEQWLDTDNPRVANEMTIPRQGLALVRSGSWIYAIGGIDKDTHQTVSSDSDDAFDTIERARILGVETMPRVKTATSTGVGSLDAGTWYYRVSAVMSDTDSVNPGGESLASFVKMVQGGKGTIQLSWSGVPGAASYNLYRNVDSSGNGGDVRLLASGVATASYNDDGSVAPAIDGVTPLPFGSLSRWVECNETMLERREGLDAVVATVPSGNDTDEDKTYLFVVGGRPDASGTGYLTSGERAEVLENGELGPFEFLSYDLNTARAFYVLITNQGRNESGYNPNTDEPEIPPLEKKFGAKSMAEEPLLLIAVLGDDQRSATDNSGLITMEISEIVNADLDSDSVNEVDNGAWVTQDADLQGGKPTHGHDALLYFDYLFIFFGVDNEDLGSDPLAIGSAPTRFEYSQPDEIGLPLSDMILGGQQSQGGASFNVARSYYEMERLNGYLFAIGGNDGDGPIATLERSRQ